MERLRCGLFRAIAATVLGDAEKVKYVGVTAKVCFTVLQSGEVDVLVRDSTLTFSRDTQLNLSLVTVNFYAGQAFMAKKSLKVASTKELNGATICMLTGATLELNIVDYGAANGIKINSLLFDKPEKAFAAAEAGRCDGYSDDSGSVAAARSTMSDHAQRFDSDTLKTKLHAAVLSNVLDQVGHSSQAVRPFTRPLDNAPVSCGSPE